MRLRATAPRMRTSPVTPTRNRSRPDTRSPARAGRRPVLSLVEQRDRAAVVVVDAFDGARRDGAHDAALAGLADLEAGQRPGEGRGLGARDAGGGVGVRQGAVALALEVGPPARPGR